MLWANDLAREAVRYSHGMRTVVDVYRRGSLFKQNVPVVSGSITGDRGNKSRLTANVDLALNPWEATGIDAKLCRFMIWQGLDVLGADDMVKLGEFRVDEVSRDDDGLVSLTGSGLEQYVIDARFVTPRTPPYGESTTGHITTLIQEVLPEATVIVRATRNKPVQATAPWERERWDAIEALAESIDVEVFAEASGAFVIADVPSVLSAPVAIFDEGPGGMLVTRSEVETRDRVYNAVSVSGSSSDPNVPPVWGWAYDSDPASDTYYYGAFGQVPRFYSSQFFASDEQCAAYAQSLLAESLAENSTIKFETLPLDFLEVGDVAGVRTHQGDIAAHLIQTFSYDLGGRSNYQADTLSAKSVITDGI